MLKSSKFRRRLSDVQREAIIHYAEWGFHGRAIATLTKCTLTDVYKLVSLEGIRLRDYRDALGTNAKSVVRSAPVVILRRRTG